MTWIGDTLKHDGTTSKSRTGTGAKKQSRVLAL